MEEYGASSRFNEMGFRQAKFSQDYNSFKQKNEAFESAYP